MKNGVKETSAEQKDNPTDDRKNLIYDRMFT